MAKETTLDYIWVMQQIKGLYSLLTLSDPVVIIIDMEWGLMNAITSIFPRLGIAYLLCTWYINNNITINCKKIFNSKKAWDKFFDIWQVIIYAPSESEYQKV